MSLRTGIRFFFVRRTAHERDAIDYDRRSARRNVVINGKILLFFIQSHVGQIPKTDQPFLSRQLLHKQSSIRRVLVHVRSSFRSQS